MGDGGICLTNNAIRDHGFDFSINIRKPHFLSQKTLGFSDALMALMGKL